MLIWLESAPVFGIDDDATVTTFIDQIVSCKWPIDDPQPQKLIHKHSHACRKKSKSECRFNYPQPPMRATEIMYPLGSDISQHEVLRSCFLN